MKKIFIIFLFVLAYGSAEASHIVGGEFELTWISGNTYRLRLIYYFDVEHNPDRDPEIDETTIQVSIFQKARNARIRNITLSFLSRTRVEYTQLACANSEVVTDKLIYTATIQMTAAEFGHPNGYYIAWERCCRNYDIDNIYSENPMLGTRFAGQTFYLEFPAVVKDGLPFINNSPRLFPPLNDFACPGIPYYVDFAGIDDDRDSLSYSLITPLNTLSSSAIPNQSNQNPIGLTNPGPYPSVLWRPGFGLNNILDGLTNLKISQEGFLTVTPSIPGLYVFAVKCNEFRDGIKIGEIIRDFQMFVVEVGGCPFPAYPAIVGRKAGNPSFTSSNLSVTFEHTSSAAQRCVEVSITDASTLRPDENNLENIKLKAVALNFNTELLGSISLSGTAATISNGEAAVFTVCFPSCPFVENVPIKVGIVVLDDACALPLTDTLQITAIIEIPPNQLPAFVNPENITDVVEEGESMQVYTQQVTDADNDVISYSFIPVDFIPADYGMTFNLPLTGQQTAPVSAQLTWDPKCNVYDFTSKTNFELLFVVDDLDFCRFKHPDTTRYNLSIDLPGNFEPLLTNSLLVDADTLRLVRKIYDEPIVIDVIGTDEDTDDRIVLRGNGIGFDAAAYGVTFPKKSGFATLQSQFNWPVTCLVNPEEKNIFEFLLTVVDSTNKCRFYKADSLILIVTVEEPDNIAPVLTAESENETQPLENGSVSAMLGNPISIALTGTDIDSNPKDKLTLEIIEQTGNVPPAGFKFKTHDRISPLTASFMWEPDCSIFEHGVYENSYTFKFLLKDDRCYSEKSDTLTLHVMVKDVDGSDDDFIPPNVFTPNGDDKNPFFAMVKEDKITGELINILPKDNCTGEFRNVRIYNRWGKRVYESSKRDFRWYGTDMPAGVYYYLIAYSNKLYKGMVSIQL